MQIDFLTDLNESQRKAVEYCEGPSLVIAGAGSGKTRVLTYKIAYLIEKGFPAESILALTFTNKAAREMKNRISKLIDPEKSRHLWMGTFHSIFSRILRSNAELLGYTPNFTIYDASDSKSLVRSILKELNLDDKVYRYNMIYNRISIAKNSLLTAEAYSQSKELIESDQKSRIPLFAQIYKIYQERCKTSGAMDFDDLLLQTNILFRDFPEVLLRYQNYFKYILVDEYQDTNFAQHLIVKKLSALHNKVCVVGDDAQSIYSFRGANIENILKFRSGYENCKIFKLEQNYRSTQNIVKAANSLIEKNKEQIPKEIFSELQMGDKIRLDEVYSDIEESYLVASTIREIRFREHNAYTDFAVLYRTNAQSRVFENAFRKENIPYRIYGGLSFYQRQEVKDLIAYFRVVVNPDDEEALKRIINYPTRGIGNVTLSKVIDAAQNHSVSLWAVISNPDTYELSIHTGTLKRLNSFKDLINSFRTFEEENVLEDTVRKILKDSGIGAEIFTDNSIEGLSRKENIEELVNGVVEYADGVEEETGRSPRLAEFLSEVALLTDQDEKEELNDYVTLMTVHSAKGLEFKNVFVVGLEEGLFPSRMSMDTWQGLEEERRLFYVAITRAMEHCYLTFAKSRFRNGKVELAEPSRFIKDLDQNLLEQKAHYLDGTTEIRRTDEMPPRASKKEKLVLELPDSFRKFKTKSVEENTEIAASVHQVNTDNGTIRVGMRVKHERFGFGVVDKMEGEGSNMKATVTFDSSGVKTLLLRFARLSPLET